MAEDATVGFKMITRLGSGTFGRVYAVKSMHGDDYAVKRMFLYHSGDFVCSLRELDLLILSLDHPFIVKIKYIYNSNPFADQARLSPPGDRQKEDKIWMVMEKARGNIHDIYKIPKLKERIYPHLPKLFAQFLLALEFLHNHDIIHLDVKPENLLIYWDDNNFDETVTVKISDLGNSKHVDIEKRPVEYKVITSYYRAPEVVAKCPHYGKGVDIWSAGIMFYYLLVGNELLDLDDPIESDITDEILIQRLDNVLPFIKHIESGKYPNCNLRRYPNSNKLKIRTPPEKRLKTILSQHKSNVPINFNIDGVCNLIGKMLILDYIRPTPTELLKHEFFKDHTKMIQDNRIDTPQTYSEHPYYLNLTPDQLEFRNTAMTKLIQQYYNTNQQDIKKSKRYYSHRVMFLTMDLIDRCFIHENGNVPTQPEFPVCSNILSEKDIAYNRSILLSYSCLYIALKYFENNPPKIEEILPKAFQGEIWKDYLYFLEMYILCDILVYSIYRLNIYEVAKRKDSQAVKIMIKELYRNPNNFYKQTPSKIYEELERQFPELLSTDTPEQLNK